jgi:hypothetical protein
MEAVAFKFLRNTHPNDTLLPAARRLDVGFHHADAQSASAGAHRAHARLPFRDAWHELLVGDEADQAVLGAAAAGQRCGSPSNRRELDERSAVHQK